MDQDMEQKQNNNPDEKSIQTMRNILVGLGTTCALFGLFRQAPVLGKSYMEFIEGPGYMILILGLIMVVLGFSVRLLMGDTEESSDS